MANLKVNQSVLMSPINASRGIVICDVDDEEPKTILEIGGPSRSPSFTLTALPIRPTQSSGSWTEPMRDAMPMPYVPYPIASDHRMVTMNNNNGPPPPSSHPPTASWTSHHVHDKALQNAERGKKKLNAIDRKSIGV